MIKKSGGLDCRMDCGRKVYHQEAELCQACYSGIYYWQHKTPTEAFRRQKQLTMFQRRLESLSNVRVLRQKTG